MGAPGLFRTFVFPTARLLVWGAMALPLLRLAFGRSSQAEAGAPASPSAVLEPPAVGITRGDVTNTVQLTGAVTADPPATVKATATGQVGKIRATVAQFVEEGTPLFTVVVPVAADATPPALDAAGNPVPTPPKTRAVTVTATAAGTLSALEVLPEQAVSVGDAVATVSPGTLTVAAPLTQEQQFRLLAPPSAAQVTVPGGPRPFECTDLRTGTAPEPPPPTTPPPHRPQEVRN